LVEGEPPEGGSPFVFKVFSLIIFFLENGGYKEMRSRRLFLTIIPLVVAILFGGARFSSSRDLVRQFTMDNGLKVILEENNAAPAVALQIWVKIGGADESDEEAGICHFIEHMLFKGTEKRKVREAAREIESLGGSIGAYTSYDQTVYHVTLASRYAETGLDILSDAIQHSIFDPFELEREREVILEEIRRGKMILRGSCFNRRWRLLTSDTPIEDRLSDIRIQSAPFKEIGW